MSVDELALFCQLLPDGDGLIKKKRGRKRKVDKLAEQALAEAVAMRNKSMWAAGNMDMGECPDLMCGFVTLPMSQKTQCLCLLA